MFVPSETVGRESCGEGSKLVIEAPPQASEKRIEKLFQIMVQKAASDLHLKDGSPPILRVRGELLHLKIDPLDDRQIRRLIYAILTEEQTARFEERGSLDISYEFAENSRVRIAVFRQRGKVSLACRLVKNAIPTFEQLHLPAILGEVAMKHHGLTLVCGPTGCGKSTTLAAMIDRINQSSRVHVLTIEDPIEYSYKDDKAIINQREINIDVPSWEAALKAMVRADPDVVLIGEMRDPDTFQAGLAAAETGHLVFGTIHSSSAAQTFSRILEMFPQDKHRMLRQMLSSHLNAIIVQMLLPSSRKGVDVVPAVEIMINNAPIRNLISRGEEPKIADVIPGCTSEGMQDFVQALAKLVKEDLVLQATALEYAPNRDRLLMALRGISMDTGRIVG
jgi:twitching motility protein PilT